MTTTELDAQNTTPIQEWLDINSTRCQNMDDDPTLTRWFLKIGMEGGILFTDDLGRVWGQHDDGSYYPFHFSYGKLNYGLRLSSLAAN